MALRAIRGATCLAADDVVEMNDAVAELLTQMISRNEIDESDFVSILFTCTQDITSGFPAVAAREIGFADVPLMCAQEMDVPGSMPRVIRVLAHVDMDAPRAGVRHVFLRGAQTLRRDLSDD